MLQRHHLPALPRHHHGPPNCPAVLSARVPLVWPPLTDHIRSRPSFHIALWESPGQRTGCQMEPVNGLSPTNRRTIRASQSMARTIPEADHCQLRGLEHRASDCHPTITLKMPLSKPRQISCSLDENPQPLRAKARELTTPQQNKGCAN